MDPADRRHIADYRLALSAFRLDRGHCLDAAVAAVLDAVLLLHDPAGCVYLGEDAHCASEYDTMAARLWARLVQHHEDHDEFVETVCRQIVFEEMDREFRAAPVDEWAFCEIVDREFGVEVQPLMPSLDTTFHDPPNAVLAFADELVRQLHRIGGSPL